MIVLLRFFLREIGHACRHGEVHGKIASVVFDCLKSSQLIILIVLNINPIVRQCIVVGQEGIRKIFSKKAGVTVFSGDTAGEFLFER